MVPSPLSLADHNLLYLKILRHLAIAPAPTDHVFVDLAA